MMRFPASRVKGLAVGVSAGLVAIAASFAISPAIAERSTPAGGGGAKACNSATPCFQRSNAGAGAGLLGASAGGNGVVGQTTFFSTSKGATGILGADLATPNPQGTPLNNAGVTG